MKALIGVTSVLCFIILFTFQSSLTSCTKDKTIYDTVTVVKTDTVITDTAITLQLLTANSWKMQEIRGVVGNTPLYYLRGGTTGNTDNYDNEYLTFNANKTGVYVDPAGGNHQLTWDFSNSTNTKITFVIQNPSPAASQTVVYENLRYKNKALYFDQYWTYNGTNSHAQGMRIAK